MSELGGWLRMASIFYLCALLIFAGLVIIFYEFYSYLYGPLGLCFAINTTKLCI